MESCTSQRDGHFLLKQTKTAAARHLATGTKARFCVGRFPGQVESPIEKSIPVMTSENTLSISVQDASRGQRGLYILRILYFFYFAGIGAYWTFINVYFRELGLSGTQIGFINTVAPLVGIFSATMWGLINDRVGNPRLLLTFAAPGVIAAALTLSTIRSYGLIILVVCVLSLFNSALPALMDNTTLRLLGERRGDYGKYRVLGSVGFIITSFSAGYVFQVTGLHWLFYTYAAIMTLFMLGAFFLPNERIRIAGSVWNGLSEMVRQPAWLLFAMSAFLLWVANNGTMNFIGITVQMMGGSASLIGLVWMASAITEIPILIYSGWLISRLGTTRLLVLAFIIFIVRGALLAVMPAPGWAPAINLLGGVAYAFFWISAVNYANDSAPDHLKSTGQGLLFSILNLASMAGATASGWLFDQIGPQGLFWSMSAFAAAGLLIFIAGRLRFAR
jgi:MFS transporter, PPP family, 3-phenylpropionic acid transporter